MRVDVCVSGNGGVAAEGEEVGVLLGSLHTNYPPTSISVHQSQSPEFPSCVRRKSHNFNVIYLGGGGKKRVMGLTCSIFTSL